MRLQKLTNTDSHNISTCISHFFGPDTAITKLLINVSNMESYSELSCFMSIICLPAAYRLSTTEIYYSNSVVKDSAPIGKDRYSKIWKNIGKKLVIEIIEKRCYFTGGRNLPYFSHMGYKNLFMVDFYFIL